MITRRQFVTTVAGLAIAGLASTRAMAAPAVTPSRGSLTGPLRKSVFLPLIGQTFTVSGRSPWLTPMKLTKVSDGSSSKRTEQFSLVFAGPRDVRFLEGIYTITHSVAGKTKMLLQPKGRDAYNRYYTAVFNLLL
ncbi:MAG: hypothetical protein EXR78_03735 [Deltaproteobacteria bacterium]|nr:hypothetical protein [Deltaproteobacteria bacterium]